MLENALFVHIFGYIRMFELTVANAGWSMIGTSNWLAAVSLYFSTSFLNLNFLNILFGYFLYIEYCSSYTY